MQSAHPRALTGGCGACAEALVVGGCSACRCRCSVCQTACHGPLMYAHRLTHAMEHWQKSSTKKKKAATKPSKACNEGLAAQAGPPGDETPSQPQQAFLGAATACTSIDCRYCMLQCMCCAGSSASIAGRDFIGSTSTAISSLQVGY